MSDNVNIMQAQADIVVEDQLKIGGEPGRFIDDNWHNICERLEQSELHLMKTCSPASGQLMFISDPDSLFMNGIVHAGSSLDHYRDGVRWVKNRLGDDADTDSVLAAFTFYYIVSKALKEFAHSQDILTIDGIQVTRGTLWDRIKTRVETHVMPTQPVAPAQ
jgi:hypothetical protein